ncbi:MAG: IS630 family transposase [Planctomycetaceae bacterium]|nr:MAG: IS630 family transposase [Planctomycetaceae bacterium]
MAPRRSPGGPGGAALQATDRTPAKLSPLELRLIPDCLWHGAEAYGFAGELWTCQRVAGVIQQEFGVRYSRSQVSRLLKGLGWTPQMPITRAVQRDEAAIAQWRAEVWPQVRRQARLEHKTLLFIDESGFYLLPGVVKTYAPRGLTPVLYEWQSHDHLGVMAGLSSRGRVWSLVRQETLAGQHTIAFLLHVLRLAGPKLLILWDRSPIHRAADVGAFLAEPLARQVHVEWLPPYAPELNPVEGMWEHLKHVELRNQACGDLEELHMELHLALARLRQKPHLFTSFFQGAGLIP